LHIDGVRGRASECLCGAGFLMTAVGLRGSVVTLEQ
jgi:hypothetical protein